MLPSCEAIELATAARGYYATQGEAKRAEVERIDHHLHDWAGASAP